MLSRQYFVIVARGSLTYNHSFLEFRVSSSPNSFMKTASVINLVVGLPKHRDTILMLSWNSRPSWYCSECWNKTESSFFSMYALKCSLTLSNIDLPVWPLYFREHSLHVISYTQPRVLQSSFNPSLQMVQLFLPQD